MIWMALIILIELLLLTHIILNVFKIWDWVEMMKTAKKTAKIMNDSLEETLKGVKKDGI